MAIKAGRVGVNRSDVDELGHVTSGGMTPEERAKLDEALVAPITAPTEKELVGVGTANEQIMFKIGDGLSVDGETSPFTLKTNGGSSEMTVVSKSHVKAVYGNHIVIVYGNISSGTVERAAGSFERLFTSLSSSDNIPANSEEPAGTTPEFLAFTQTSVAGVIKLRTSNNKLIDFELKPFEAIPANTTIYYNVVYHY